MSDEVKKARGARIYELKEYGDQHNIGIRASLINGRGGWDDLQLPNHLPLRVIEHSSYTDLLREAMKLREALEFYSDYPSYDFRKKIETLGIGYEDGTTAREAIANFDNFLKDRDSNGCR